MSLPVYRCAVLSAVKHDYVARGMASHPRFELTVVADDPKVPDWAHERNQQFADEHGIPYVRDVEEALRSFGCQVAIVSPEAERHCDLSIRAAQAGRHVVMDKPMSTCREQCDLLVAAVEDAGVKFLMWNRNCLPVMEAVPQDIGDLKAIHLDFYFAKDAGPPKGSRSKGYPPMNWQAHQIAAHVDGSDGGLGRDPMGELAIEGIYPLGYLHRLTGALVRRVFARTTTHFHQLYADNGVEDLASVTLEMERGIADQRPLIGSLALGRIGAASHPSGGEISVHLVGETGALVLRESLPTVGLHYKNQPPREPRDRRVANENDFLLADSFARAIDRDEDTVLDVHAAREIYAVVEAALRSAHENRPVLVEYPTSVLKHREARALRLLHG